MAKYNYDISALRVSDKEEFSEASADELRVLLALVELRGRCDTKTLAEMAKTSVSRAKSAVVFWSSAGVITESAENGQVGNSESENNIYKDGRTKKDDLRESKPKISKVNSEKTDSDEPEKLCTGTHLTSKKDTDGADGENTQKSSPNFEKTSDTTEKTTITEEFERRLLPGTLDEESSISVAKTIRDNNLSFLFSECAKILGRPALNTNEIHTLTALYNQYGLNEEYILTLFTFIKKDGVAAIKQLADRAMNLSGKGINNIETLSDYIKLRESENENVRQLRRLFGIYERTITPTEKKYFSKWTDEFKFSVDIIGIAYDITVMNTEKASKQYMDKILTRWHECGCKTPEECVAQSERDRAELSAAGAGKKSQNTRKKAKEEAPRYGTFDPEEAFARALERSYGKSDDE